MISRRTAGLGGSTLSANGGFHSATGCTGSIAPLRFLNQRTFDQLFMLAVVPNL